MTVRPVVQIRIRQPEILERLHGSVFQQVVLDRVHRQRELLTFPVFPEHDGSRELLLTLESDLDPVVATDFRIEDRLVVNNDIGLPRQQGIEEIGLLVEQQEIDIAPFGQFKVIAGSCRRGDRKSHDIFLVV